MKTLLRIFFAIVILAVVEGKARYSSSSSRSYSYSSYKPSYSSYKPSSYTSYKRYTVTYTPSYSYNSHIYVNGGHYNYVYLSPGYTSTYVATPGVVGGSFFISCLCCLLPFCVVFCMVMLCGGVVCSGDRRMDDDHFYQHTEVVEEKVE